MNIQFDLFEVGLLMLPFCIIFWIVWVNKCDIESRLDKLEGIIREEEKVCTGCYPEDAFLPLDVEKDLDVLYGKGK